MFQNDVDLEKTYGAKKLLNQHKRGITNGSYTEQSIDFTSFVNNQKKSSKNVVADAGKVPRLKLIYSLQTQLQMKPMWYADYTERQLSDKIDELMRIKESKR